jgi:NAD(P)-dependent dehydrogenase (short-subunit alcohol dehydrogenase family)
VSRLPVGYREAVTQTAVVTGANSGIGRAVAVHLAVRGFRVYGSVRSRDRAAKLRAMAEERGVEIHLVEMDVADEDSVRRGFAEVQEKGSVDVLVNNAGIGRNGVTEETSSASYLSVMNVNLCGAVRCIQAVLPHMRHNRAGTIVNISSVCGRVAIVGQSPYVASKWALEAVSEGLAAEVAAFGIRVVVIEPGVTKSAIFAKTADTPDTTGAYVDQYRRMLQMYAVGLTEATDPFKVAEVVHHAVTTGQPQLRYPISWGAEQFLNGRAQMSDADWISLGLAADDEAYFTRFKELFDLDISPRLESPQNR